MLLYYSHGTLNLCHSVCSYQLAVTVNFDDVSCEAAVLFTRGNPPVGTCLGFVTVEVKLEITVGVNITLSKDI